MPDSEPLTMDGRPVSILHLEDDPLDRELVATMLSTNGMECDIVYAENRPTFHSALGLKTIDLIISDFSLPGYDGSQALIAAREMRREVPFIFFSGTLGEEAAVESLRNGATDYVVKQRPGRLAVAVRRALADAAAITARERMEEELRERDRLLRKIMEGVEDLVSVVGLDGRWLHLSPSQRQFPGAGAPSVGGDFFSHAHPDDRARLEAAFKVTIAGGLSRRMEYRVLIPDETMRIVEAHVSAMRDEQGRTQSVLWVSRDITERRQAERRIREQAALLDKARDAIFVCDLDRRISYWNQGATHLYGWQPDEAIGQSVEALLLREIPPEWSSSYRQLLERQEWIGEISQFDREGREVIVQCRQTLVCDEAGIPISILYINSDITEQKQIEAQLLRTQRMESIGALAGGVAHDLNNVLGPIMMAVEIIQNDPQSPGNAELLDLVGTSAKRGSDLVRQILSFARGVKSSKTSLQFAPLVVEVIKMVKDTFPRTIAVRAAVPDDLPAIQGDPTQLHQILLNLCVNARDAMPEGGTLAVETAEVSLERRTTAFQSEPLSGRFIELKVTDSGTGIAPEVLAKIFEPFFTTKEMGKGTGLGLSTVLGIVKGHGGLVDVTSLPGKGTTFSVYLPVPDEVAARPMTAEEAQRADGRRERILVVDNEVAMLELTRAMLGAFNYEVLSASSGAEALAIFVQRHTEIDLVITDLLMPEMDGDALIRALRRIDPNVPVVPMSVLSPQEMDAELLAGMKGYVRKPYAVTDLLDTVRAALEGA